MNGHDSESPLDAPEDEYDLCYQRAAMAALEAERRRLRLFLVDMEARSGVSINSFCSWKSGVREPTISNLVAVCQTLGFDVIMKRRDPIRQEDSRILPVRSEATNL